MKPGQLTRRMPLRRREPTRYQRRRGSMLKPGKGLARTSAKKRAELRARAPRNRELRENWIPCQAQSPVCTGRAQDQHELLMRSAGGSATDRDNIIDVCRFCHGYIHGHPAWAVKQGLLHKRWAA